MPPVAPARAPGPPGREPARTLPAVLLALVVAGLVWTRIGAHDGPTWWMEVAPVLIAIPILWATARRFPLTPLLMVLLAVHALVLMVGGHWTYARVPLGDWIRDGLNGALAKLPVGDGVRDALHLERNPYDRIGHLTQGFVPAILGRELLIRTSPLRPGRWLFALVVSMCLAFSAFYELIEWWTAVSVGSGATDFIGSQGDVWDAQWDMCCALIGAIAALLLLSRVHDRQLARMGLPAPSGPP